MEKVDINQFEKEITCTYRNEAYSVRDNGSVFRFSRNGKKPRPSDNQWTFGKPNKLKGYFYLSSEPVHRIVATAFHGQQPSEKHIVDHIDTNQKNNRPENLRWLTRLENLLLNPVTLARIIYKYGSIDNFLADPSKPLDGVLEQNFDWMRTVTKEESDNTRKNLLNWAIKGKIATGGQLGEWIFLNLEQEINPGVEKNPLIESLTPNAAQKHWKTPSIFPCCPQEIDNNPIVTYTANLKTEKIFSQNQYFKSIIVDFAISKDTNTLWVLCKSSDGNAIKPYSLAQVTYENRLFVHNSLGSFFKKDGAVKQFTLAQGLEWTGGQTFDDLC